MTPLTAQQTVDRAKAALQSGAAVGLPELLQLLETLTTNYLTVNLDELTVLVEKDVTVLAKVITVANTIAHNPGFSPITNISQAIHLVGFQRIRSFTASLMMLENTGPGRNLPEQREAAGEALCAGLFAAKCAEHLGTVEPDMAFAAATLRYFGLILLPSVSIEHTRAARERLKTKPPDIAYRGMFGLTPLELSRRMLASSRLPDEVVRSLREFSPKSPGGNTSTLGMQVTAVAELGSRVAALALNPQYSSEDFFREARRCALQFERLVPEPCEFIATAVQHTADTLHGFLSASGSTELPIPSLSRIRSHALHCAPQGVHAAAPATPPPPTIAPEAAGPTVDAPVSAPLPEAAKADEVIAPEPTAPVLPAVVAPAPEPKAWDVALEASGAFGTMPDAPTRLSVAERLTMARDFVHADESWLFEQLPGGDSFALVGFAGPERGSALPNVAIRADERSVFGVALTRRQVVLLHDTQDAMVVQYLPTWWQSTPDTPRAIALVPVGAKEKPSALALLGWRRPRPVTISRQQLDLIREICTAHSEAESDASQVALPASRSDRR